MSSPVETLYSTPGTYVYTVPAGVTSLVVECIGAGGAGGSMNRTITSNYGVGGGGGGAYASSTLTVTPGATYSIIVGAGAQPSTTVTFPGKGGSSSFIQGATSLVMADSGNTPSLNTNGAAPTNGGTRGSALVSIGTIKYDGGWGQGGATLGFASGGGGGAAGRGGVGQPTVQNGTRVSTGGVGSTPGGDGGSGRANPPATGGVGFPGLSYGGGGGGCWSGNQKVLLGGNGANGVVIITYTPNIETCYFVLID
ncbi:hypothetical protein UFOVP630_29 [uncultured Caudovirales phage]|uniref:Glycine-rich domain-containing protein n=1 Tax=uncultured Caudovirales phage TaxID=2100421 RepID=A0A6J5N5W6_9CAUD|nr:hypothetical protein UFOVP630_29 [uncultured Caudovirales phage]